MERFYSTLGWIVFLQVIAAVAFAYRAPNLEQSMAVLWVAQLPVYAYLCIGAGMVYKGNVEKRGVRPSRINRDA